MSPDHYRYPNEHWILALTILAVLGVIAFTATATVCGSVLFTLAMVVFIYFATQSMHNDLIEKAQPVTPTSAPQLATLVESCRARLGAEPVKTYVVAQNKLNAYTFGLSSPKVVVIYAPLLKLMDADELRFIVGHELGHVALGHTWLNSLVGGLAGIPSPFGAAILLHFAFRWWNRACEFSADRAGLLACGNVEKAVTSLVRIATGLAPRASHEQMQRALAKLDAQDDDLAELFGEALGTHPLIIRRITALRQYAASAEYQRLQAVAEGRYPVK